MYVLEARSTHSTPLHVDIDQLELNWTSPFWLFQSSCCKRKKERRKEQKSILEFPSFFSLILTYFTAAALYLLPTYLGLCTSEQTTVVQLASFSCLGPVAFFLPSFLPYLSPGRTSKRVESTDRPNDTDRTTDRPTQTTTAPKKRFALPRLRTWHTNAQVPKIRRRTRKKKRKNKTGKFIEVSDLLFLVSSFSTLKL